MSLDASRIGEVFGPHAFEWDADLVALYALAVGAKEDELELLLESRGPEVLPTFSVLAVWATALEGIGALGGDMLSIVHGAQRCTLQRPIPDAGRVETRGRLEALHDKGKGALAVFSTESRDGEGVLFETEWQIYYRGLGGFGGERGPETPSTEPPPGAPDHALDDATSPTQALLYRLVSKDKNPIHSEPAIATAVGFERPILHGLCTFGVAARALRRALGGPLRSIEGRFAKPVLPGDVIRTEAWGDAADARFRCRVGARDVDVVTLGRASTFGAG